MAATVNEVFARQEKGAIDKVDNLEQRDKVCAR